MRLYTAPRWARGPILAHPKMESFRIPVCNQGTEARAQRATVERGGPVGTEKTGTERFSAVGISRRDFLKISGAGLVGASLLGIAGCSGGGGGSQQGGGGGGAGGNSIVTGIDQEPAVLNRVLSEGQLAVTNDTTAGIVEAPLAIQPDLTYKPVLAD